MNDLDDRLTDLLARSAAAVDVRPDLDAVRGGGTATPLVDLGRRPRDTRRLLALAAAVLVLVGLAAVAIVGGTGDDRPRERAEAPATAGPDRFPVFGHLPAELEDAHVEANDGEGSWHTDLGSTFPAEVTVARTALGRVAANGQISDTIQLAAADQGLDDGLGPPPSAEPDGADLEDLGDGYQLMALEQEVWLYGPDRSVTAVGSTGAETEAVVRALVDVVKATADPVAVLGAVEPPDGLAVIAPPSLREEEKAEALVPVGPPCDAPSRSMCEMANTSVAVETGTGQPELAIMSVGGTVTPVDIGGGRGLLSHNGSVTRIAWTAPSGVNLSLIAEVGTDEALAIARGIELVDRDTWRETYPEWDEDATASTTTTTTPTTEPGMTGHPLLGQAAPEVPGLTAEQRAGRVVVLGFGPNPACEGCGRLNGAVVDPGPSGWEPAASVWASDDGPDPEQVILAHGPDDLLGAQELDAEAMAAWAITELPTTVVVGADGIVRDVLVGGTTVEAIEAAVQAALDDAEG